MDILEKYVREFNADDEECYKNDIDNSKVLDWMKEETPLFECPDKDIERAYYFRFWTYRKHIKTTEDGVVITEFLPDVPWGGRHNTINAAVGHHLYEGRWLRNANKYLKSYIKFFLTVSEKNHMYSAWLIDAIHKYETVRGDLNPEKDFLSVIDGYYAEWEASHGLADGSFWSIDNYDAMEFSVSGTGEDLEPRRGVRPTLNSYMCADALAISEFARMLGNTEMAERYLGKHKALKQLINEKLFEDGFYRAYHYDEGEDPTRATEKHGSSPRELIGYIPFMFDIPEGREECFGLLTDPEVFFTEYGLTTVEKSSERFLYEVEHECLWDGYIWPFATSETRTGLARVARKSGDKKLRDSFYTLLSQYARMHRRVTEGGKTVSWIDEVIDPRNGDWSSRTMLRDWGWKPELGGYERGKDYNHSTFIDLVISGLAGISVENREVNVSPLIPESWDYFRLQDVRILGRDYTITYDRTGERYGRGQGLVITAI